MNQLILATRRSPLALVQANLVAARLLLTLGADCTLRPMSSTGDRQAAWSLETRGGKGLFTAELEESLRQGEADLAVHSAKDLPGELADGLVVAGYLPRADARDVLVHRAEIESPRLIATGSPRRRAQLLRIFSAARFTEIRGNVDTRLKKIAAGEAEATVLAAAGLSRLGISSWRGLKFRPFGIGAIVPAVGQGAIAVQCRPGDAARLAEALDLETGRAVEIERAIQAMLGAGCHTAIGAHVDGCDLHLYHERIGMRHAHLDVAELSEPRCAAERCLRLFGLI